MNREASPQLPARRVGRARGPGTPHGAQLRADRLGRPPEGETRAARYGARHLEQLLQIHKWSAAGVSLEHIRKLLHGTPPPVPPCERAIGSVSVCSHLAVAEGVEVVIDPQRAGLSPEAVRQFIQGVMAAFEAVQQQSEAAAPPSAATNTDTNDRQAGEP